LQDVFEGLTLEGILRKDPSRLHQESLGMNPNARVEDQYIDNLMKQIHFMGLEINLLKQKQEENKDVMGIRGLMNKDKQLHVDHIIEANSKFMDLLKGLVKEKIVPLASDALDSRRSDAEEQGEAGGPD
jgi:hypothetical protein